MNSQLEQIREDRKTNELDRVGMSQQYDLTSPNTARKVRRRAHLDNPESAIQPVITLPNKPFRS
ncbi:hypothetical protein CIHG_04815 [Coccidioides immitis H538.4]|uniref:Uncharacterized protein n=3 Tax=Coccidioides immitis TaxID=5501 RepID=A0A0J8TL24_COCIT|nr:hypothetical protein CIRG_05326 [Coccidioides immitis RMSCC 2394]KMU74377.1 hypothetical protein CISG_04450 [Coccidioides immitis RMSCC 3703]KMU86875.1 hypothetical protein CIHG_04815 [Coccidioides immitis H538.4]